MSFKHSLFVLLLTLLIMLKIESVQSIAEGSLVIKVNQRFCIMLIYHDVKDEKPSKDSIIAKSCSVVISDKLDNVLSDNNHTEALIKISIENLKDKLTKIANLDEDYFFHLNSILIGCYDDIKYVNSSRT